MTLRTETLELAHAALSGLLADHQRTLAIIADADEDTMWYSQIGQRREIVDRYQAAVDDVADELRRAEAHAVALESDAGRIAEVDRAFS